MPSEADWWMILRRTFDVPDIVGHDRARVVLIEKLKAVGPPDGRRLMPGGDRDHDEVTKVVDKLVECAAAGKLDRAFAPLPNDGADQVGSVVQTAVDLPYQNGRVTAVVAEVVEYVNKQPRVGAWWSTD